KTKACTTPAGTTRSAGAANRCEELSARISPPPSSMTRSWCRSRCVCGRIFQSCRRLRSAMDSMWTKRSSASRGGSPYKKNRGTGAFAMPAIMEETGCRQGPHQKCPSRRPLRAWSRPRAARMLAGMRTQVAIIGAGPAGLLLAQVLHLRGIDSVVLEIKSQHYVEHRVRAGLLEHQSVDILQQAGVGERMMREGLQHEGVELRFAGRGHRIDFAALTGRGVTIYGQQEVVRDLVAARLATGRPLFFEVSDVSVHRLETSSPHVRFREANGNEAVLQGDFIAGCDGFHGICRPSIPEGVLKVFERVYPFAW